MGSLLKKNLALSKILNKKIYSIFLLIMKSFIISLFLCIIFLNIAYACVPPDCDRPDYGSCGNACCKLQFTVQGSTEEVAAKLNKTLDNGGPDGRYIKTRMASGDEVLSDYRAYNIPIDFIGQIWHTTEKRVYNDTINFNLAPTSKPQIYENLKKYTNIETSNYTKVEAFSISQIGGAYGDSG